MTAPAPEPFILLLKAAKATLDLVDYQARTGITGVTVRHGRFRSALSSERPGVAIVFVDDKPMEAELDLNAWENLRVCTIEIHVDVDIPIDDETGLDMASILSAATVSALQAPGSPLAALVNFARPTSVSPDDRNQSDMGRLVRGADLIYRVRSDDQNVLLAEGVNG